MNLDLVLTEHKLGVEYRKGAQVRTSGSHNIFAPQPALPQKCGPKSVDLSNLKFRVDQVTENSRKSYSVRPWLFFSANRTNTIFRVSISTGMTIQMLAIRQQVHFPTLSVCPHYSRGSTLFSQILQPPLLYVM